MNKLIRRIPYYRCLWTQYILDSLRLRFSPVGEVTEQCLGLDSVSGDCLAWDSSLPSVRVYFWVPYTKSAGAKLILEPLLSFFRSLEAEGFQVEYSSQFPVSSIDILISFKAVPKNFGIATYNCLVICDEVEYFWRKLPCFDEVIVTSSLELLRLVQKAGVKVVTYMPEYEPDTVLWCGDLLGESDPKRIFWHGGSHSLGGLKAYVPVFEKLLEQTDFEGLSIVSGGEAHRTELWGRVPVKVRSWSRENLVSAAAESRFAVLPARSGLKHSYLKPASRVRCVLAMGLMGIGSQRTPEVRRLADELELPVLTHNLSKDLQMFKKLWNQAPETDAQEKWRQFLQIHNSQSYVENLWRRLLRRIRLDLSVRL